MDEIRAGVLELEAYVDQRMKKLEPELRAVKTIVMTCPACSQDALVIDGGSECLFCQRSAYPRGLVAEPGRVRNRDIQRDAAAGRAAIGAHPARGLPLDVDAGSVSKCELARRLDPHVDAARAKLFVRGRPSIAASGLNLRITVSGMFGHRHRRRDALARGGVLPDLRREITFNDAIDFLHAVVPVTFCDAVLLDGATHDLVERARRQYPGVRMAATFSGRGDGINRFLAHLASG